MLRSAFDSVLSASLPGKTCHSERTNSFPERLSQRREEEAAVPERHWGAAPGVTAAAVEAEAVAAAAALGDSAGVVPLVVLVGALALRVLAPRVFSVPLGGMVGVTIRCGAMAVTRWEVSTGAVVAAAADPVRCVLLMNSARAPDRAARVRWRPWLHLHVYTARRRFDRFDPRTEENKITNRKISGTARSLKNR